MQLYTVYTVFPFYYSYTISQLPTQLLQLLLVVHMCTAYVRAAGAAADVALLVVALTLPVASPSKGAASPFFLWPRCFSFCCFLHVW